MDDGALYQSSEEGTPTNKPCKRGDVIKCSVKAASTDSVVHCERVEILFSRNSEQITSVLTDIPPGGFYGVVGMMSHGEKITLSPPMATQKKPFQDVWEVSTPQLVSHRADGICLYTGSSTSESAEPSIGSVRGKKMIDPTGEVSQRSFALRILNQGERNYIGLGVVDKVYPTNLLPGWEDTSIGYHADTGDVFQSCGDGFSTGHPCKEGDLMECVVHAVDNSQKQVKIVFSKNGIKVMEVTAWTPHSGFYFCFGMMSKSEVVQALLPDVYIPFSVPKQDFEDVWEVKNANIEHRGSGICHYIGNEEVGTVRSKHPVDPFGITNSYEVKILDPGNKCFIALGVCSQQYSTDDLPGWDDLSVGFHADDGCILQKSGGEESTRNPCSKGDVIRCTLEPVDDSDKQMSVIFHKNKQFIGKAIFWKPGGGKVFAQIGCMSVGEVIQIASPLQKISHLKPDHMATPVTPRRTMGGGVPDLHVGGDEKERRPKGFWTPEHHSHHGYHSSPQTPEQMQQFLYTMYHHFQSAPNFRGNTMPMLRRPMPSTHPDFHHGATVPQENLSSLSQFPSLDYSMSYPPPVYGDAQQGNLTSQQSEPTHKGYFKQTSSSSSSSETPSLLSSQLSVSSQISASSLEAVPEESDTRMLYDHANQGMVPVGVKKHPLHLQLTGSPDSHYNKADPVLPIGSYSTPDIGPYEVTSSTLVTPSSIDMLETHLASLSTPEEATLSCPIVCPTSNRRNLLRRSSSIVIEPDILSKDDHKIFKMLHNTSIDDNGLLQYVAQHPDSPQNAFIMFRLPLNEKLSYFQIEIHQANQDSNVALGLVWDHYPVYRLPGTLEGSVAFHSKDSMLFSGKQWKSIDTVCAVGDVIGCRAALQFKSEVFTALEADKHHVKIEFFKNGLSLCTENSFLPPNGFFPAIGITGFGTKVRVDQNIQLSPLSYFDTHPFPPNFPNFAIPPPAFREWQCLQNSKVDESILFIVGGCCGKPAVVQNLSPFSSTATYFQVQLHREINTYSVFSIGAAPKLQADSQKLIPGESLDCIGYLPLLGFIMSKGMISCTIPEVVSSDLYMKNTNIGVGIEFIKDTTSSICSKELPSSLPDAERVRVFFTINTQEVSSVLVSLPKGGFYPTLAVESELQSSSSLAKLEFPKDFPYVNALPLGFTRGAENGFLMKYDSVTIEDTRGLETSAEVGNIPVRSLQAAQPLSPSKPYFEIRIHSGGNTRMISCGVASFNYPLDNHPGCQKVSIAFHAVDGSLYHNGSVETVAAALDYDGALIGCGARFPTNSTTTYAEVFFTVNHQLIAVKLVQIPQMGLFPTIGMNTKGGMISIDRAASDPFSDLQFKSAFGLVENIKVDDSIIELISSSNPGAFQLKDPMSLKQPHYFTATCLSNRNGRVMIGFSTNVSCPLNFLKSMSFRASMIDIVSGKLMICNEYLKTKETCIVGDNHTFGVGIEPINGSERSLLFFTANDYVVAYTEVDIHEDVYPCVLMMDSTTRLKLDLCSFWPKNTPIGSGWARYFNLKLVNSAITHSSTQSKKRLPVGFAQTSYPLTAKNPYFEVEICARATNRAIAIGLASKTHPSNQWIGWTKGSIGYHSDDGKLFKESNFGHSFGHKAYSGDVIGCGARFGNLCFSDFTSGRGNTKIEVYFTINGALLNTQKVTIPPGGFYPTVCLESPSESVLFLQHKMFPPVASLVNSEDWENAYSVHQIGRTIKSCCRHKEVNGGLPKGFCQARQPFTPNKPYFEVEIVSLNGGQLEVSVSVKIAPGCTTPNTHSIVYNTAGKIISRKGSQKYAQETVKSDVGDRVGCAILYDGDKPDKFAVFINDAKVFTSSLIGISTEQDWYPTIILPHSGISVIPTLQMNLPILDHAAVLIGWLRSERVKIRGTVVEYVTSNNVGIAQIRQPLKPNGVPYYEVKIINPGEKCTIAVGLASSDYPLNMQPGWCKNSIAYHGDDGKLFHETGNGIPFASSWKQHDVIGLGIRSSSGKCSPTDRIQVYFTKNGVEVGHTTVCIPDCGFFPTIGFHSAGERVKVNLGTVSTAPCNYDSLKLRWQALSGIKLQLEKSSGDQVLSYCNNGRKTSPGIVLSVAIYATPFSETMQYFEVELLKIGSIGVAIGVAPADYPLDQAPGWLRGSIAYHTDNGMLYNASGKGKEFGPIAYCGDIIGCGVTFTPSSIKHSSVFFTYNGMEIGRVRTSCSPSGLYPVFGLTDVSDRVSVKFLETFKPKLSQSEFNFVGLMRINNCSYSEQIVKFKGLGNSGYCSSPAVAQFAVPLSCERNYFAANIIECNDSVLIGLAVKDYPLRFTPGTTSVSLAYDVMKGSIKAVFNSNNFHSIDAPVCSRGDTIGCGINFNSESKSERPYVFFTKNNVLIRKFNMNNEIVVDDLYPIICFVPHNKSSSVFMDWNSMTFVESNDF